jgi:signal transduction histidine kinase
MGTFFHTPMRREGPSGSADRRPGHEAPSRAAPRAPSRSGLVRLGRRAWTVLACLAAAQLLVVGLAVASGTPSQLLLVAVLTQAAIAFGAATAKISDLRRTLRRDDLAEQMSATSGIGSAEALLAREQERMHELRGTVAGVVHANRLLNDHRVTMTRATRRRLQRLLDAELARIERLLSDTRRDPVAPVDLADVLDPLVDAVRLRGHAVRWAGTPCRVLGRPDDIAQIAHILLDNAARHASGRRISLEVTDCRDRIELRVSDDGPGVSPRLAPLVFDRGTRSATSGGEGIGLHIARRLARDLGGDLQLEPGHAAGAVFVLQLLVPAGAFPCLAPAV